ncbi:MAG: DUF3800 domain-containing protein [Candidatus Omnitrophica bacterium]|nr:DUF3800 domain-containing protein [Candidatus Omnitrophota bacterium]
MLFFIDESWQATHDQKLKAGVLAAVQIKSHDFNECSQDIYSIKASHLGRENGNIELKGKSVLGAYQFRLESRGIRSKDLALVREILSYMATKGTTAFASVVFAKEDMDLACADSQHLERPFFYLFERINLFMKENHPGLIAKLIFDDRGVQTNQKISISVSNFFHKSSAGRSFDSILKVPLFAISKENVGIQVADIVAYTLGGRFTGDKNIGEFFKTVKSMEFKSRLTRDVSGVQRPWLGFKIIKDKEAGDLRTPIGIPKPMRGPEGPPPTSTPSLASP